MAISDRPISIKMYYKNMVEANKAKSVSTAILLDECKSKAKICNAEIKSNLDTFEKDFKVNLLAYEEFVNNKYTTGTLLKLAKGLYLNRTNDYLLVSDLFDLVYYAKLLKRIHDLEKELKLYNKCSKLTLKEYTEILRVYYTEVHKQLILEGNGYSFSDGLGWICINRCIIHNAKPMIDWAATRQREKELIAAGKRIYNKEEAEWCEKNGIEYKAEDKRVFKKDEYCYEIPLLGCTLPNAHNLKLEISDYRHTCTRGKTTAELIELADNKTENIIKLSVDLKVKLNMCDKVDKILYTKFIRNENQESVATPKAYRKGGQ